jgi:hypothetical protein
MEELREMLAVLPGDTGDERSWHTKDLLEHPDGERGEQ